MITIELDEEIAAKLSELAEHEHISLEQLLKKLTQYYTGQANSATNATELLTDFAGMLKNSPSFQGNPLDIQLAIRNEWT
ncbi:conserved hypothetical protein [Crenothrix polyspora]|uniref:Ribbon-helix-helix protein CopG domain-containing protein n=1 Tax=Crenothrix polyspora TaxID=360316 RepID=A0A1R4HHB8_9GAMM|nr:ribbon-helix-helix protein, CopG family [Crenothrix polyspora]SJM95411.1 conserved hypothetical protein [Crenothrix polyspora]